MFRKPCASGVPVGGMLFPPLKPSSEEEDYYTAECGVTWRRSKRWMKLAWSLCELAIWEWQIPWRPECSRGRSHRFVELPWFMLKVRILFANYRYFIFYSWLNIPKRHTTHDAPCLFLTQFCDLRIFEQFLSNPEKSNWFGACLSHLHCYSVVKSSGDPDNILTPFT